MNTQRGYSIVNRSESMSHARHRILQATLELATEKLTVEIVLADVAARCGVTVQTILRHFGSRNALFDAVVQFGGQQVAEERVAPVGDVGAALDAIVNHYELRGDWAIALLGQENSDERIRGITTPAKQLHRDWVEQVFALELLERSEVARATLADLLAVATDVYTWKLLRRDRLLGRDDTQQRMRHLVDAILASAREENSDGANTVRHVGRWGKRHPGGRDRMGAAASRR